MEELTPKQKRQMTRLNNLAAKRWPALPDAEVKEALAAMLEATARKVRDGVNIHGWAQLIGDRPAALTISVFDGGSVARYTDFNGEQPGSLERATSVMDQAVWGAAFAASKKDRKLKAVE